MLLSMCSPPVLLPLALALSLARSVLLLSPPRLLLPAFLS